MVRKTTATSAIANAGLPIKNEKYPEVPKSEMYLLRNKVSHEYYGVD